MLDKAGSENVLRLIVSWNGAGNTPKSSPEAGCFLERAVFCPPAFSGSGRRVRIRSFEGQSNRWVWGLSTSGVSVKIGKSDGGRSQMPSLSSVRCQQISRDVRQRFLTVTLSLRLARVLAVACLSLVLSTISV